MKGTKFFAALALAAAIAAPSIAGAVCPAKATYFFSGGGYTTLAPSALFTSQFPAANSGQPGIPVNFVGTIKTTNGVSCATGCLTTATATGIATENAYTASSNVPNSGGGGFDGISCDTTFSINISANCPVPTGSTGTVASISTVTTTVTSAPDPAGDTPALVCSALIGSTLSATTQQSNKGETFSAVDTRNVGCTNGTVPCSMPQAEFTDVVTFNGDINSNTTF